jgi:hypothetical protein
MKELMYLNRFQLRRHLLVWLFITLYLGIGHQNYTWSSTIIGLVLVSFTYMFAFYSIYLLAFPLFWGKNILLVFISIAIILILYWIIGYINTHKIIPYLGGTTYYESKPFSFYINVTFNYFFITASAATASFFSRYGLYKLKQQAEKEKLLITKEINFMRNQFNSRLTFDFLDYCNHNIKPHSPETAESVALFSDMLKYTLQTQPNEKVPLQSEITYIENFISIQKLLSSNVYVNFSCKGNTNGIQIIPRILITFVENGFKHGTYNNNQYPLEINLEIENNHLLFKVKNKINPNKKVISSHTGLANVQQALELHYAGNFELYTREEEGFYYAELTLSV